MGRWQRKSVEGHVRKRVTLYSSCRAAAGLISVTLVYDRGLGHP